MEGQSINTHGIFILAISIKTFIGTNLQPPTSLFRINNPQLLLLAAFIMVIIYRNFFLLVDGLGEPDAVRFIYNAIVWHHSGGIEYGRSQATISPGYLSLIKHLISAGISYDKVIIIMNSMNAACSALLLLISFFFFRLFHGYMIAFACTIMLSFVPSLFVLSIYGFPTLLAYTAFCISILIFVQSTILSNKLSIPFMLTAMLTLCIGTILKADIILLSGGYIGVLIAFGQASKNKVARALLIITAGAIAPIIFKLALMPTENISMVNSLPLTHKWNDNFPSSFAYFFSAENINIILKSIGPVFSILALLGIFYSAKNSSTRRMAWVFILLALPLVLFWGPRPGNSARHMLGLAVPSIMMIGVLFHPLKHWNLPKTAIFSCTVAAILLNYFSTSASSSTVAPSSRLLASAILLKEKVSDHMSHGTSIADNAEGKTFLIEDYSVLYSAYNVLTRAQSVAMIPNDGDHFHELNITFNNGKTIIFGIKSAYSLKDAKNLADKMRGKGFIIWSDRYPGI